MNRLLLCLLFGGAIGANAQQFPKDFLGQWKGQLLWYQQGKPQPQKVAMSLQVSPADTANHYNWTINYATVDNRPYLLKSADTAKGKWVIDERNGIVLTQQWLGNRFTGAFAVQKTLIVNSYSVEGSKMVVEFYSLGNTPADSTGLGTDASPLVQNYSLKGYQRAVLYRQKAAQLPLRKK